MSRKRKNLCRISTGSRSYRIGGIKYIVSAHFAAYDSLTGITLRDRMTHSFKNGFAELPSPETDDNMPLGYACSEKREEDVN
ncbi:MAG: hypothetical protein IKX58_03045 [Clostridia bacterium]|nr:hypothetical protein [Clostridia bacterium]